MRLSVVVPCFNEEQGLAGLHAELSAVLPTVTTDFEVVLVDDGSTDRTLGAMRDLAATDPHMRYVALSRNFGKEAAMLAGLHEAEGDVIVIMDADLQHPPDLIKQMVDLLATGYDQVVARRDRKGEGRLRKVSSKTYYKMMNRLVDVRLRDGEGDFRVMSRRAVDALLSLGEYNRFSKGLFAWIGFDTAVIDYENRQRQSGSSKWTLGKLLNYGIDGVVSFNNRPLRLAVWIGLVVTLLAFAYAGYVIIDTIVSGIDAPGYATLMVGIAGIGGLQLLFLGIVGEYVGRIYYEAKRRPHFLVKETSDPEQRPGPVVVVQDREANR
ncbi:glycosyltransferase family 2 protein [Kibdelosporangium lantanae]|uniref:Glycosyltransferase family 2 protein n=1 Tax=Kibdelosporangium lantanae TaxID=1497396 RepID=A0ABW3M4E2_9PSEU